MRLFDEHKIRNVQSLDGAWRFSVDQNNVGVDENWCLALPSSDTVIIPSVWNTLPGLLEYEGVAWYQRDFYTDGGTLRFVFGAVMIESLVYLDGNEICRHYGGFCQFEAIVRDVAPGNHRLTVRVDNSFNDKSIPQALVDWYHYGGITRSVSVETLKGISILSNRVKYEISDEFDKITANVALELYNADSLKRVDRAQISIGDNSAEIEIGLNPGERREVYTDEIEISNALLWSPDCPNLYSVSIFTSTDDLLDRVGFRKIEVKECRVVLNGKKIRLHGVNRHEEHPDFGFAFPPLCKGILK